MAVIIIILVGIVLFMFFKGNGSNTSLNSSKSNLPRLNEVEHLNDDDFISFVKNNYGYYDKYFTNEGIGGNRASTKWWSTSKYTIKSDFDDDNFSDYITIIRKRDNKEIFSSCWGNIEDDYE